MQRVVECDVVELYHPRVGADYGLFPRVRERRASHEIPRLGNGRALLVGDAPQRQGPVHAGGQKHVFHARMEGKRGDGLGVREDTETQRCFRMPQPNSVVPATRKQKVSGMGKLQVKHIGGVADELLLAGQRDVPLRIAAREPPYEHARVAPSNGRHVARG
jgi:hypothetical protein